LGDEHRPAKGCELARIVNYHDAVLVRQTVKGKASFLRGKGIGDNDPVCVGGCHRSSQSKEAREQSTLFPEHDLPSFVKAVCDRLKDIAPGAQTKCRGDAGPVRILLGGLASPAAVLPNSAHFPLTPKMLLRKTCGAAKPVKPVAFQFPLPH
jgi:hypothetical protein